MITYPVAIFAHNEERFIERAIRSVLAAVPEGAEVKISVLINGSKDRTAEVVRRISTERPAVAPVEIELGDKCHAWNTYVYELADDSFCHFFMDGDCQCSPGALEIMANCLRHNPQCVGVGGVPQNGRSRATYRQYQTDWGWVFGGLYGVRGSHLRRIREAGIRLPIGLKGNDHFITRLLHAPLPEMSRSVPEQVAYDERAGYLFDSLKPWRLGDARIYWNRSIVYCLRQRQIPLLDSLPLDQLPLTVDEANQRILRAMSGSPRRYYDPVEFALYRRLRRMYPHAGAAFYNDKLQRQMASRRADSQQAPSAPSPGSSGAAIRTELGTREQAFRSS